MIRITRGGMVLGLILSALSSRLLAEDLIYVVEEMKGPVSIVESGQSKARPAALEDVLDAGDEIRTGAAGEAELTLNQNTSVHLGPSSRLKVAQLVPNSTGGFLTKLKLLAGKVVSQVQKLAATRSSYVVEAGSVSAGVRGTLFEVGLSGEDDVETSAEEGEVELSSGNERQVLGAGRLMAFRAGKRQAERVLMAKERERFKAVAAVHLRVAQLRMARAARLAHPKNDRDRKLNEAFMRRHQRRKSLLKMKVGAEIRKRRAGKGRGKGRGGDEDDSAQ